MTKTMLDIIGTLFVVLGIAGFVSPDVAGMHLSPLHNVIHIAGGSMALGFGVAGKLSAARLFSWSAGRFFVVLGIVGMTLGRDIISGEGAESNLLVIFPNLLELGRSDHLFHLMLGIVFLAAGAMARLAREQMAAAQQ